MGNVDSKRHSTDSIMGCRPNRTRQFSELPDDYQFLAAAAASPKRASTSGVDMSAAAAAAARAGVGNRLQLFNSRRLNNKKGNKDNNEDNKSIVSTPAGGLSSSNSGTPPIFIADHRVSLSPPQSDSGASLSTMLGELAVLSASGTVADPGNGTRSAQVRVVSPTGTDNASLQSLEVARRPATRSAMARRAKSFRNPASAANRSAGGSFRRPVCALTGLTDCQKRLIALSWRELNQQAARAMIHAIFDALYRRDARLLQFVGCDDELVDGWRQSARLRIHVQRFHDALHDVIGTLHSPALSADRLLELGAEYRLMIDQSIYCGSLNNHSNHSLVDAVAVTEKSQPAERRRNSVDSSCRLKRHRSNGHLMPLHYWEALIAAFSDAVQQAQRERQPPATAVLPSNGFGRHRYVQRHNNSNVDSPTRRVNGGMHMYSNYSGLLCVTTSDNSSPSYLTVGDEGPPQFQLTTSPSPTPSAEPNSPQNFFLYPSFNSHCGSASPTPSDYSSANDDRLPAGERLIVRHGYGNRSFNALAAADGTHRHYMSAPSYGNYGVASPLAVPPTPTSVIPSPSLDAHSSLSPASRPGAAAAARRRHLHLTPQSSATGWGSGGGSANNSNDGPAVQAWNLLAIYVVGQIRFGYEMECALQERAARLAEALRHQDVENVDGGEALDSGEDTNLSANSNSNAAKANQIDLAVKPNA